jgi:hypothetical protein
VNQPIFNDRLVHDAAFLTVQSIIDAFPERYFADDKAQVAYELYIRIKAGMEYLMLQDDRMQRRLRPMKN